MGDAEPDGGPFTLMYNYSSAVTRGPYAGGGMFVPAELELGAMMEYGRRFRANFERDDAVGMPPEHLRAISRGLARFAVRAAGDKRQAPWVARTGMLAIPRDSLLGGPLEEAARGYLSAADPDRADDANLGRSVRRFVALASSSPDAVPGYGRSSRGPHTASTSLRSRERDAASARTLGYPYMIHGGPEHELWLVDYVNTLPFLQSLAGEVYFAPGRSVAARTSTFDRLLAESLERVDGIEAAFVADRPDPNLPNVEFRFDGSSQTREIDVPLRCGRVLVAVQTWTRNLDPGLSGGEYRAMRRRWEAAERKLRSTDEKYTDYLLHHPEGKRRMGEQGLGYVLPVLCGPFTDPVPSLEPRFWLRPLSTGSYDEALKAVPRILSPAELESFLSTATERELRGICEANDWEVEDD